MNKKPTTKDLMDNLAERFNTSVNLEDYSFNDLVEMKQTLSAKISKLVEQNNYNYTHKNEYQKNTLFVEILEAEIEARRPIVEGEEMKARLVVGVSGMIDDVKNWMQKTSELKSDEVIEYSEIVRDEMGADTSQTFSEIINGAFDSLYAAMEQTHNEMLRAQDVIMGKDPGAAGTMDTIGSDETMTDDPALDADPAAMDAGMPADDDFGATAPAAGGDEPADRTRRESIERSRRLGAIMSEGSLSDLAQYQPDPKRYVRGGGRGRAKAAGKSDPRATEVDENVSASVTPPSGGITPRGMKTPFIKNGMVHEYDEAAGEFRPTRRATDIDRQSSMMDHDMFSKKRKPTKAPAMAPRSKPAMKPRSKKRY